MANYHFDPSADVDVTLPSSPTLAQRVFETLREEILTGQLRPGDRLVRRALGKRLGVSPVPVTEALLRLEVEGLVQNVPLYGCRLRPLSLEDVRNDEMLREAIECQAARLCAENASTEEFSRLNAKAKMLDRMIAEGDPQCKLGMQTHQEFHGDIARAGKFVRLAEELERVWFRRLMRLNWFKATHYGRLPENWHQQLVQVLAAGDPDEAEAAMRRHVRFGSEDDLKAIECLLAQNESDETP
jgi:GntR family transcriptional regulator, rspAB operon transcriptional repressor